MENTKLSKEEYEENSLVSIIVPVYNGEKYIEECLRSIMSQSYKDFEVLVVDDGSSDNSALIVAGLAEYDDRIKLLQKENGGVGSARNLGLESAMGDFITFVDADDYIEEDYLEVLMRGFDIKNSNDCELDGVDGKNLSIDVVASNYKPFGVKNRFEHPRLIEQNCIVFNKVDILQDCLDTVGYTNNPFAKIFRKTLLAGMSYCNMQYAEDALFNRNAYMRANGICKMVYAGYNYRINMSGASHNPENFKRNCLDNIKLDKYTYELINQLSDASTLDKRNFTWQMLWDAMGICIGDTRNGELFSKIKMILFSKKTKLNEMQEESVRWVYETLKNNKLGCKPVGVKQHIAFLIIMRFLK